MRQIPSEGEYCGDNCYTNHSVCMVFNRVRAMSDIRGFKRLPECVEKKPQVLTEHQREENYADAFMDGYNERCELFKKTRASLKEAHDEQPR